MSLEIIIQEIKVYGYVLPKQLIKKKPIENQQQQQYPDEKRKFRISFGSNVFISKQYGIFRKQTQLCFYEPYSFYYDNHSNLLQIQIFREHQFGKNDDFKYQMNAEIDLSDSSVFNGDYIETDLTDINGQSLGNMVLAVDVFKKGPKYYEKVVSSVLIEKVQQQVERVRRQMKVSATNHNIKNLMVNQKLSDFLMTINSMHIIPDVEDTQIFNKQCFVMIKYGPSIKIFSKPVKSQIKDSVSFMDYLEFIKTEGYKFQFFFMYVDEFNTVVCKARGEIKYIAFDQTINAHTILLFDKKTNKYGVMMVKFIEKQIESGAQMAQYKTDKKIKNYEEAIGNSIDQFNRYKFEAKYNNHLLSEKIAEMELQKIQQMEQKNRPMNEEQKKKASEHKKFISFLQKQVIRIERELNKRQQKNKNQERKDKYLPVVSNKSPKNSRMANNKSLNISQSSSQFREGKLKLPHI